MVFFSRKPHLREAIMLRSMLLCAAIVLFGSSAKAENCQSVGSGKVICDNGVAAQRYGQTTYWNDGTISEQYGTTTYNSDGSSARQYGNTTIFSDGGSARTYGNRTYFSDGRSCYQYGRQLRCD